jgi:WD40 repeat protein
MVALSMSDVPTACPKCGCIEFRFFPDGGGWICDGCNHSWPAQAAGPLAKWTPSRPCQLFLSYGRTPEGELLAERLEADLTLLGYAVWRDRRWIRSGTEWDNEIEAGLRSSQLVLAMLTRHAVREESVCRDELSFARFACKLPIVPLLAEPCEPPFVIFRLDYIDLCSWCDSVDRYKQGFRRLVDAIESRLRGEPPRYRRWDERFPQFDFGPFLYERRQDFCGREWLFERIEAWREQPDRRRALLITGDPGIGKSAIVAELVHRNPGGQVLAYHCCRADTPETLRSSRFIRGIAGMIASQLEGFASQLDDPQVEEALSAAQCETDPASAFEEGLINPLHRLPATTRGARYLLIDALDEALTVRDGLSIVQLLAPSRLERLRGWLRVVATTRKEADVLDQLRGLRAEQIEAHDPRNLDDIERFLAHRLGEPELAERLAQSGLDAAEAIRRLTVHSDGNFLWIQQALTSIMRGEFSFDRIDELPAGLPGLYRSFFERHFPDDASYAAARRLLEVVVAAAEPLTAGELAATSGLDPDYELPRELGRLAPYLPERDGRHVFYHRSLADWLTDPATFKATRRNFAASPHRGHERLSAWCWAEHRRGPARMSPYALRYLPRHLIECARWNDLASLLQDLPYLECRAEAGLVFDLAMDFTRAGERVPADHSARRNVRLIEQALRSDLHFIARHPSALFQCLWNRGWWYDCAPAALHHDSPPGGWPDDGPPWGRPAEARVATLLESWRATKERETSGFVWLESLRPPPFPLGGAELACLRGHQNWVCSVAFDRAAWRIVSGAYDNTVRVWDAGSGAELACLQGHQNRVTSVAIDRAGRHIVSGSLDRTVRVWDAESGAELVCLRGHRSGVTSVAFDRAGRRIVSASSDRTVRVWDAESGAELVSLVGHKSWVTSVAFNRAGQRIASASYDNTVRVWDAESGAERLCLRGHENHVASVAFDRAGGRIVSGSSDRTVRTWDAESGAELACVHGHQSGVTSVAFDHAGRRIVSGSLDNTVRVWDAESGAELACLRGHEAAVRSVASDRADRRIVSGSSDRTVRVWDAESAAEPACLRGHTNEVTSLAFDRAGGRIASGSRDKTVRVWDAESGAELASLHGHKRAVTSVAFDRAGRRIVSGSDDNRVRIWDAESFAGLVCLRGHNSGVTSVAFDPSGRRIASGSLDKTVRVWDSESSAEVACLRGHEDRVTSVAFDPSGRRIVSGSSDRTVRVWDAKSGVERACLRGHKGAVQSVAYSPDGHRIASESWDERVRVWDAESGECLEVMRGSYDVAAIAAGEQAFPWRAVRRREENEITIVPAAGGAPIARFPAKLRHIVTHSSARLWAGSAGNHVYLIKLVRV